MNHYGGIVLPGQSAISRRTIRVPSASIDDLPVGAVMVKNAVVERRRLQIDSVLSEADEEQMAEQVGQEMRSTGGMRVGDIRDRQGGSA